MLFLLAECYLEANLHGLAKMGVGLTTQRKTLLGSLICVKHCRWCLDACLEVFSGVKPPGSCEYLETREGRHDVCIPCTHTCT